ncbi:LysR family transcriptional regulator [Streptomyces europaeiscabiei]|uniref:LysR substrate-binding domain-containing protein n=1 Tax=Streptomyces europaeiscabiei TaxID=146819 RepID=UPI0029A8DF93|nr:LysR substrate-binding domain-containing protein [Streptomyces europaeiscabiei]MDX3696943.1 LysR family transcriptional regulator [Streptomyces europaeiscabiei]
MYHDLQVTRLRTLVAVVECGGFRRAAVTLHITQPAVSQQIRQLESLIQGPVFTSTGRNLQLSVRGEELLGYARRVVALNDEAVDRLMPRTGTTRLSIGIEDQLAEALPEFLRLLSVSLPEAQVSVRTGPSESLASQVTTGQIDLALLFRWQTPETIAGEEELGRIRMAWFGQPVHGTEAGLPLALFTEPCILRGQLVDALDASGISWRISYEGAELVGLRAAVKAGLGLACLVDNGDDLWGLPRAAKLGLPSPPGPIPVMMALPAGATSSGVPAIVKKAFRQALDGYPFAEIRSASNSGPLELVTRS